MASGTDFATGAANIGGAVSALFGARGAKKSSESYGRAADIADQNAIIAHQATQIKLMQANRQIYKTLGEERADVAGAGFATSGSAIDILRDSASQGAVTKAILSGQGAITENAYREQAEQFRGMRDAALESSTGQEFGGLLQGAAGLYSLYEGASTYFSAGGAAAVAALA